ncbi:MAG: biotin/lipoyl-containing protein [Pseudomonadota bacterium]
MSLTAKDVAEILKLLEDSRFNELTLEMNGVKIELRRGAIEAGDIRETRGVAKPPRNAVPASISQPTPTISPPPGAVAVPAPLLGIYYRAPKPGEPSFVEVGDQVTPETIVGIIEVMKLMNTVRAGVSGEVLRIDSRNGELVEFGQTILFVKPR